MQYLLNTHSEFYSFEFDEPTRQNRVTFEVQTFRGGGVNRITKKNRSVDGDKQIYIYYITFIDKHTFYIVQTKPKFRRDG